MCIDDMFKLNFTHTSTDSQISYVIAITMLAINEMCDRNEYDSFVKDVIHIFGR